MKRILIIIFMLLLLSGAAGMYFLYFHNQPSSLPSEVIQDDPLAEQPIPEEELNLVQIPSFRVPVLHNKVAVKILVFHIVLNMDSPAGQQIVNVSMSLLIDMYIRYLVAHYEINSIDDRVNVNRISRIIADATQEVIGPEFPVRQVIIQGVYEGNNDNDL